MNRRPELTIIAGPNGAGKSRLCPFYVSAKSFDGDKLMLDLRREHPDWPDRWVSGTVASQLEKQKTDAADASYLNLYVFMSCRLYHTQYGLVRQ